MAEGKGESVGERIQRRNEELGRILAKARSLEERTKSQCADHLGITRQRYALVEEGKAAIGAAELEELVRYLRIPAYAVWPIEQDEWQRKERLIYVQAQEGESVHVIVGPYDAQSVPKSFSHEFTADRSGYQETLWWRSDPGRPVDTDILKGRPK